MPELPEMENYKILLTGKVIGKPIDQVIVQRPKSVNLPKEQFISHITGKQITRIERRAKYLLFYLDTGKILLLHLMLGGKLFYGLEKESPDRTKQITFSFGEYHLYFIGLRLGYLHLLDPIEVQEELKEVGPEPLADHFSLEQFTQRISQKRKSIKNVLLDQAVIAGIGNRYSDEVCFAARVSPKRPINELNDEEIEGVYQAIKDILQEAIQFGGYMDLPLYKGDQRTGGYLKHFKVHGREGENCQRCGATIKMEKMGSRKVYFCPNCQK